MIHTYGKVSLGIDSVGGNITSFQVDGEHIFLPQQIIKENGQLKVRGGSHMCFPNFGPLKPGFDYELPQHGFARDTRGKIRSSTIEPGDVEKYYNVKTNGATPYVQYHFKYRGPEIENDFPYPFKLVSNYIFLENGFLQQVIIVRRKRNHDEIPIGLGLHPYFYTESKLLRITFETEPSEHLYIGPQDNRVLATPYYPLCCNKNPNKDVTLSYKGKSVGIKYGGMFETCRTSQLKIWRHNYQSPYICIEPIVCEPGDFGEMGSPHLLPNENSVSAWMVVTVE